MMSDDPRITTFPDGVVRLAAGPPAGTWEVAPHGNQWQVQYVGGADITLFTDAERYGDTVMFASQVEAVAAMRSQVAAFEARATRRGQ